MHRHLIREQTYPIGFGRTLLWAGTVTLGAGVMVGHVVMNQLALSLAAALFCATLLYPFVKEGGARAPLRGAFLGALLLWPSAMAAEHPALTMLAAASIIAVIRSWVLWPSTTRTVMVRESSATALSVALGWYFIGAERLDVGFAIWGFCLGQLVATLTPFARTQVEEDSGDMSS